MKIPITLLIFLISHTLFGQNILEGIIKNSETKEPIPYVNIGVLNKDKGTVSDEKGNFTLDILKENTNDTLRISSIGYKSKSYIINELQEILKTDITIELIPEIIELTEVVITGKNLKEKILGNKTKSKMMRGGFRNAPLGHELGIRIKIKKNPTYIEKFHTNVTSNTGKSMKFRLNFYSIKNGLPYESIINEKIIFQIDSKEGEFTLDLSEYNIVIEEDFYFTVELIENQKQGEEIFFSTNLLGKPIVTRQTSQGKWKKLGSIGIGFNMTVKY